MQSLSFLNSNWSPPNDLWLSGMKMTMASNLFVCGFYLLSWFFLLFEFVINCNTKISHFVTHSNISAIQIQSWGRNVLLEVEATLKLQDALIDHLPAHVETNRLHNLQILSNPLSQLSLSELHYHSNGCKSQHYILKNSKHRLFLFAQTKFYNP